MPEEIMNVKYESTWFVKTYSAERNTWEDFYDSERIIMKRVFSRYNSGFSLLDAGCACGGLLSALQNRYLIKKYKGIDIVEDQIEFAKRRDDLTVPHIFECQDISKLDDNERFDIVVSFSCVDFNLDVHGMLDACWSRVRTGGYFIASFRLTNEKTLMREAYQMVDMHDGNEPEKWNYVVFNFFDLKRELLGLKEQPANIEAYGYWGKPNPTAVVPYDRLCFSVFAIKKGIGDDTRMQLDLPADIM